MCLKIFEWMLVTVTKKKCKNTDVNPMNQDI